MLLVGATSMVLILFTAWRWGLAKEKTAQADLMFAAAIVISLAVGSHMFTHDLSPLLLAMFLVIPRVTKDHGIVLRSALWTTLILLWIPAVYFALIAWHRMYLLFPALIIFAAVAMRLAADPRICDARSFRPNAAD